MTQDQMDFQVRSDINLLGCLSDAELFNGSSCVRAIKPIHTKTLLEDRGIVAETYPGEHLDDFCFLSDIWLDDNTNIAWERISSLMPTGRKSHRAGILALRKMYPEHLRVVMLQNAVARSPYSTLAVR